MSELPPTIIVVHPKEKKSKCTVEPLRGHPDFRFWKFPRQGEESLENYVRLGIGGPVLSPEDANGGLLVLDGTWKLAAKMEPDYQHLPVRSLPGNDGPGNDGTTETAWQTAYPRVSKIFDDPEQGLATIEAIYAAHALLGRPLDGLLDSYYWKEQFLELNAERIQKLQQH